jgi:hypothetical protein
MLEQQHVRILPHCSLAVERRYRHPWRRVLRAQRIRFDVFRGPAIMAVSDVLTTARPAVFQDSGAGLRISALALDERKYKGYNFFDSMFHSLLLLASGDYAEAASGISSKSPA